MSFKNKIQLKSSSILNIPFETYNKDFLFLVNGQEFHTNRFISDLLSPKISLIHSSDPTIDRFIINTQHKGDFSHILQLTKFDEHEFDTNEISFIFEVASQLGHQNFNISIHKNSSDLTIDNIIPIIQEYEKYESISSNFLTQEIEFISSHFYEIIEKHREELNKINISTLFDILTHPNLLIRDEDQLLQLINHLYEQNHDYIHLYETVLFKNVNSRVIQEFIDLIEFCEVTNSIWIQLSNRLSCEIEPSDAIDEKEDKRYIVKIRKPVIKTFLHREGDEFNGIIKYLTDKTGGNLHDNKIVELSTNSFTSVNHPKNLLNYNQPKYYMTRDGYQYACILFDFKNMEIEVSKYSIKSYSAGKNISNVKNWIIEISKDGKDWTKIDEHINYSGLNGSSITKTFDVKNSYFARYFRFSHTDEYFGYPEHVLAIDSMEIYGRLKEP